MEILVCSVVISIYHFSVFYIVRRVRKIAKSDY